MSTAQFETTPGSPLRVSKGRTSTVHLLGKVLRSPVIWLPCVFRAEGPALNIAALRGDVATAKRLLQCGADPNYYCGGPQKRLRKIRKALAALQSREYSALVASIEFTNLICYPTPLLAALHNASYSRRRPLYECADRDMVALLLEHGASVRLRNSARIPVLHMVTDLGRADLVKMVLDYGAPVNARDHLGDTALAVAIGHHRPPELRADDTGIAKLLFQRGASLVGMCSWDSVGDSGARYAAASLDPPPGHARFLALALVLRPVLSEMDGRLIRWVESTTDLHLACLVPDAQLFEAVLEKAIDVNGKDAKGLTAFEFCAIIGNRQRMEILVARGADMHCVDEHGLSLLHRAVLAQRVDLIKFLVEHGEDVNRKITVPDGYELPAPDDSGLIPSRNRRTAEQLLNSYATRSQLTPIQLAVLANRRASITALVGCHAALDAFRYPAMPLQFGAIRHGIALTEQLQKAGSKPRPQDTLASVLVTMADSLHIKIRGNAEELQNSLMDSLGWSISDLLNLHDEQDETARLILCLGLETYQDLYLFSLGKSLLEVLEEEIH